MTKTDYIIEHASLRQLHLMKDELLKKIISAIDLSDVHFNRLEKINQRIKERDQEIYNEMFGKKI